MGMRKLRVYTGPAVDHSSVSVLGNSLDFHSVNVLPILADAVASDRTWLNDFQADEIIISADLFDVIQAYRNFRRPGA